MRSSGNNRGGSSNRGGGSGGGRGKFVYRKKKVPAEEPETDTSPAKETTPEQASDVVKTPDTTTPTTVRKEKEKDGKPPAKQMTAPVDLRPRSKGDQRRDTQNKPAPKKTQAVWAPKQTRVQPRIGDAREQVTPEHINWVRDQFDRATLKSVWERLAAESPRREKLMYAVVRQAVRAGIYEVMGTRMKSMANIHADGTPLKFTDTRAADDEKVPDVELTDKDGNPQEVAVWNASRKDAEVEVIRDVLTWAMAIDPRTLSGKEKVVLQIVGNSGSCDACKKRLTDMGDTIQREWRQKAPNADLPQLEIWCYYSNDPTKMFKRGDQDTFNGWSGDVAPKDLSLTSQDLGQGQGARFLEVYEHRLRSFGPAPKRAEVADTSPESTITPVTTIPGTQTDKSKPSKEEDIS